MSDAPAWLTQLAAGSLEEVSEVEGESLEVTSGRVVACDPLVFLSGADPFAREVAPGRYTVLTGEIEGENAYAMLRFSAGTIATWEVARCPGEEDIEGWPGYGVDSGVGCFVDLDAVAHFVETEDALGEQVSAKVAEEGIDPDDVIAHHEAFERIRAEIGGGADPLADLERALATKPTASAKLSETGNLVAFRSGVGDGVYASFWGLDAAGKPLVLVTDFGLFATDDEEEEDEDIDDEDLEEFGELSFDDDLSDLRGFDALAAALGMAPESEPETTQGPSPLFLQTKDLLQSWVRTEKIELEPEINMDAFAEAFLELLVSLSGQRHPGSHVADWLVDRPEIADVFASDEELEKDLTR